MLQKWRTLSARARGLGYLIGGLVLAVLCAWLIGGFARLGADAGVDVGDPTAHKAAGMLGAPFAIGMALGIAATYTGVVKLALGARTDKLEWGELTAVGLLYVAGFIGALVVTGYLVLVRWQIHIF